MQTKGCIDWLNVHHQFSLHEIHISWSSGL